MKGDGSLDLDPDEDDARLTDEDLFAYLCRDGMGGFGGMTWATYLDTPDRILRDSYLAERDDDHNVITRRQLYQRHRTAGGQSGSPSRAGRELPSREALNIPAEAWAINPRLALDPTGQGWVLMFYQTWRRRQSEGVLTEDGEPIDDAYILRRFRAKAGGKSEA